MATIDEMADAALQRDNLLLRGLLGDMLRDLPDVKDWPPPASLCAKNRAVAASIAELVARHQKQTPPVWAAAVPGIDETFYLVRTAATMRGVRRLCDEETPTELRKRGFLAPPDFLTTA